ncbi:MAG TPA: LysR family transcriptional regulator, partial [Mycoplana sp.]|nr:LysR family transcriptional regulator [Mycoplana sp.]
MDLRKLRYFLVVAETNSISRASSKLGIAQPTLSRQMQLLEQELKCLLFYRDGRGVQLTVAGKKLCAVLKPMIGDLDQVCAEILEESGAPSGIVRFGIPPSIGSTIAAPLALRFQVECPDVRLQVVEGFSGNLLEWIEDGAIDLGILYDARR